MAEKINLTFLGTGSAVPTLRRNHPGILLRYKAENILFDCGEGIQRQFRKAKLNPCKVNKIFISHWHGDHTLGLSGFLQTLALNAYNGTLEIYGPKGTKKKFAELVSPNLGFYLRLSKQEGNNFDIEVFDKSPGKMFETDEFEILSESTDHHIQGLAYSFIIKEKSRIDKEKLKALKVPNGPLIAELVKGKSVKIDGKKIDGKKLVYLEPQRKLTIISDTRYTESLVKFSKDSDVLVSEATYPAGEEELADEHFHLTSGQAGEIAKKSKSKSLVLVHLSQRYDMIPKIILEGAIKNFKNSKVAEDFDEIIF